MKVVFIPQRGGLMEALENAKVFHDLRDMFNYIVESHSHHFDGVKAFSVENLSISYYCYDHRKGTDDYVICTDKYLDEDYLKKHNSPQALGFCVFEKSLKSIKDNVRKYFESITK